MEREKITAGTISRTIILAVALVNQLLSAAGYGVLPIEDATIEQLVSACFTVGAALAAWWKNNSFTQAAIKADYVKNVYKQDAASK